MNRTEGNEPSNPISRALSKFFERGNVRKAPQASRGAGTPARAATTQVTPQPRVAATTRSAAATGAAARPAQAATPSAGAGLQTAASTGARPAAAPAATPTTTPAATQRTHTVARGDTLSGIAQKVYGRADRWQLIFQANRDKLDDPDRIYPGQVLVIPDAPSLH